MSAYGTKYKFGGHKVELSSDSDDNGFLLKVDGKDVYRIKQDEYYSIKNKLSNIQSNYDFYPAEMEESFRDTLNNQNVEKQENL